MNTPLIRDGKLLADAFEGHDLSRLDYDQRSAMQNALDKSRKGERLNASDLSGLMKAHAASKPQSGDPMAEALVSLNRAQATVKEALR